MEIILMNRYKPAVKMKVTACSVHGRPKCVEWPKLRTTRSVVFATV